MACTELAYLIDREHVDDRSTHLLWIHWATFDLKFPEQTSFRVTHSMITSKLVNPRYQVGSQIAAFILPFSESWQCHCCFHIAFLGVLTVSLLLSYCLSRSLDSVIAARHSSSNETCDGRTRYVFVRICASLFNNEVIVRSYISTRS